MHVNLALNYVEQEWNCADIIDKLKLLMSDEAENELKIDLGNEYTNFCIDYNAAMNVSK